MNMRIIYIILQYPDDQKTSKDNKDNPCYVKCPSGESRSHGDTSHRRFAIRSVYRRSRVGGWGSPNFRWKGVANQNWREVS